MKHLTPAQSEWLRFKQMIEFMDRFGYEGCDDDTYNFGPNERSGKLCTFGQIFNIFWHYWDENDNIRETNELVVTEEKLRIIAHKMDQETGEPDKDDEDVGFEHLYRSAKHLGLLKT